MGRGVIMLFELKSVFLNEGLEQQLSYELDISEIDMDGVFPFTSPVAVTAIARNRAGLVTLTLHCGYDYTRSCDRCGEPFTRRENKTLCPTCGVNLNTGSCACSGKTVDPRLEILKQLMD